MFLREIPRVKILVLVSTISIPVTATSKKMVENTKDGENLEITTGASEDDKNPKANLAQVLCIQYHIVFWKKSVLTLLDLDNKINAIYLIFIKKLRVSVRPKNVKAQKINSIILDIYKMVVTAFLMINKAN